MSRGHQPVLFRLGIIIARARAGASKVTAQHQAKKGHQLDLGWAVSGQEHSSVHLESASRAAETGYPPASPSLLPGHACPLCLLTTPTLSVGCLLLPLGYCFPLGVPHRALRARTGAHEAMELRGDLPHCPEVPRRSLRA